MKESRSLAQQLEDDAENRLLIPRGLFGLLFFFLTVLFFLMGFLWSGVFMVVSVLLCFPAWMIVSALLPLWKRFYAGASFWILLTLDGILSIALGVVVRLQIV